MPDATATCLILLAMAFVVSQVCIIVMLSNKLDYIDEVLCFITENTDEGLSCLEKMADRLPHDDLEGLEFIPIRSRK